ncbi:hypothetical protein EOD39_0439 [Acipenser ruthenus]|uniref:Uncharacterized protein n=1 Tax=Acipenser ruthenus TaxID=7906 RepID=A0A444U558_ACIRT|nr:hypothetical protein EOD39_0439 [Acipenser ruthenus]
MIGYVLLKYTEIQFNIAESGRDIPFLCTGVNGLQAFLLDPAVCKITHRSQPHLFNSLTDAQDFLNSLGVWGPAQLPGPFNQALTPPADEMDSDGMMQKSAGRLQELK